MGYAGAGEAFLAGDFGLVGNLAVSQEVPPHDVLLEEFLDRGRLGVFGWLRLGLSSRDGTDYILGGHMVHQAPLLPFLKESK